MKLNKFFIVLAFLSITIVSCNKYDTYEPLGKSVKVEYHISTESENIYVDYMYPQNGKMSMIHSEQHKAYHVISFETTSGKYLSVEGSNISPSRYGVSVKILVDGKVLDEATSYSPSDKAIATGNVK